MLPPGGEEDDGAASRWPRLGGVVVGDAAEVVEGGVEGPAEAGVLQRRAGGGRVVVDRGVRGNGDPERRSLFPAVGRCVGRRRGMGAGSPQRAGVPAVVVRGGKGLPDAARARAVG
jgi:hypothetical protein